MAETIDDGYNRFAELKLEHDMIRIEYRPALRRERLTLFNRMVSFGDRQFSYELLLKEIHNRIISTPFNVERCSDTESKLFPAAVKCVLGQKPYFDEESDARNLREGLWLLLHYPKLANLSCEFCQKWNMDPITGEIFKRGQRHLPRFPEDTLLCNTHAGCPKGNPANPKGLSAKNRQALRHYLECKAVGQFPDDAIVRRNAKIISDEFRKFEREQRLKEQRERELERLRRATRI